MWIARPSFCMSSQLILLLFTSMSIAISGTWRHLWLLFQLKISFFFFKFIYLYMRTSVQEPEVSFPPLLNPDITPYSKLVQSSSPPWNLFLQVAFSKVLLTLWVTALQFFIGSRNLGIFDVCLHATQNWVQALNVIIHTRMYKTELCSGVGCSESWEAQAWASKCYINLTLIRQIQMPFL